MSSYILGIIVLLLVTGGFLWWRIKKVDDIMTKDGPGEERKVPQKDGPGEER